jgi:hypothetical protein
MQDAAFDPNLVSTLTSWRAICSLGDGQPKIGVIAEILLEATALQHLRLAILARTAWFNTNWRRGLRSAESIGLHYSRIQLALRSGPCGRLHYF